ncbi:hypothetical protein ACOSQ3_031702 [Xanthoceras sorbifolium]
MNADDIATLCANMKLTEEEQDTVCIEGSTKLDGVKKLSLCLVGRLLSSRLTNCEAFRSLIARIWRTTHAVEVEHVGGNVYAFHFHNSLDWKRVLTGGPWNFDNALLVLEVLSGYGDFSEMSFRKADFWIQIHNAPLICMTKNIGLLHGEHIGEVKDIDLGASSDCFGKFIRVRVSIDVTKPLKRILRVKLDGMVEENTLILKYERMPEYCFYCSLIGHSFKEFPEDSHSNGTACNPTFAFGTWLRATSPRKESPTATMTKPSTSAGKLPGNNLDSSTIGKYRNVAPNPRDHRVGDKRKGKISGSEVRVCESPDMVEMITQCVLKEERQITPTTFDSGQEPRLAEKENINVMDVGGFHGSVSHTLNKEITLPSDESSLPNRPKANAIRPKAEEELVLGCRPMDAVDYSMLQSPLSHFKSKKKKHEEGHLET